MITTFKNEKFGNVRTVIKEDGTIWFVGKDIAECLGYKNTGDALITHIREKFKADVAINDGRQLRRMTIINEAGMYALIMKSNLETAEEFQDWVCEEVLPEIRKTGSYGIPKLDRRSELLLLLFSDDKTVVAAANQELIALEVAEKTKELVAENTELTLENRLLAKEEFKWSDKKLIEALVKRYAYGRYYDQFENKCYQKGWKDFKTNLLYNNSININARITEYHSRTGKKTKPRSLDMIHNNEIADVVSTVISICNEYLIDISDIILHAKQEYENNITLEEYIEDTYMVPID